MLAMNERIVLFAEGMLMALAQRDELTKVALSISKAEQVMTVFADREPCGETARYTIGFSDVFKFDAPSQLIRNIINCVELQLAGQIVPDDVSSGRDF